jgi:hypothetical protein
MGVWGLRGKATGAEACFIIKVKISTLECKILKLRTYMHIFGIFLFTA